MGKNIAGAFFGTGLLALTISAPVSSDDRYLPVIDAHSQFNSRVSAEQLVSVLKEGNVDRVILSSLPRRVIRDRQLLKLAKDHPDLIIPAIRAKGRDYDSESPDWYSRMDRASSKRRFRGLAEAHLYHEAKGNADKVVVFPSDRRIKHLLAIANERNWPLVLHAELKSASSGVRARIVSELKDLMRANPDQPFILTHMAQLDADEVAALISAHGNVYFITSHANHIFIERSGRRGPSKQPWTDMFDGSRLRADWAGLVVSHPDRFILGFDNTRAKLWSDIYIDQVNLWRRALAELPRDVAEKVAYRNAERLWRLPKISAGKP